MSTGLYFGQLVVDKEKGRALIAAVLQGSDLLVQEILANHSAQISTNHLVRSLTLANLHGCWEIVILFLNSVGHKIPQNVINDIYKTALTKNSTFAQEMMKNGYVNMYRPMNISDADGDNNDVRQPIVTSDDSNDEVNPHQYLHFDDDDDAEESTEEVAIEKAAIKKKT